jgi:hypothetical protein
VSLVAADSAKRYMRHFFAREPQTEGIVSYLEELQEYARIVDGAHEDVFQERRGQRRDE